MQYLTVVPAYGRDYTNAKAAKADWSTGKDFKICDISNPWDGSYINNEQQGEMTVNLRFNKMTQVAVVKPA